MRKTSLQFIPVLFFLLSYFITSSCTVRYVADYDNKIKDEIVDVAKQVDLFWGNLLDTPKTDRIYAKFKDQYNTIETAIRGLVIKNEIRPLNTESTRQAKIALDLWIQDRSLHKEKDGFTDFEAKRHRKQFTRVFIAMAKGEEAKNTSNTSE